MTLHERHMALVDEVNNAKTTEEHSLKETYLRGWRDGVENAGARLDYCAADFVQFRRGFENRPMCCGVFNDWKPTE